MSFGSQEAVSPLQMGSWSDPPTQLQDAPRSHFMDGTCGMQLFGGLSPHLPCGFCRDGGDAPSSCQAALQNLGRLGGCMYSRSEALVPRQGYHQALLHLGRGLGHTAGVFPHLLNPRSG